MPKSPFATVKCVKCTVYSVCVALVSWYSDFFSPPKTKNNGQENSVSRCLHTRATLNCAFLLLFTCLPLNLLLLRVEPEGRPTKQRKASRFSEALPASAPPMPSAVVGSNPQVRLKDTLGVCDDDKRGREVEVCESKEEEEEAGEVRRRRKRKAMAQMRSPVTSIAL